MKVTLLTVGLCATTFAAAIPSPILGLGNTASTSDGHQITNPSFDHSANMDLDAVGAGSNPASNTNLNGLGAISAAPTPAAAAAAPATTGLTAGMDDDASLAAEVANIEKLFQGQKRDLEQDLEKRDPATLTAYLIYCLKHPKLCRAVKVH